MLYENGAQLSVPARLRVETNAIGLGTNAEIISRYESLSGSDAGSTIMGGPVRGNVSPRITILDATRSFKPSSA